MQKTHYFFKKSLYISYCLRGFKLLFLFMLVIIGWFLAVSVRLHGHDQYENIAHNIA